MITKKAVFQNRRSRGATGILPLALAVLLAGCGGGGGGGDSTTPPPPPPNSKTFQASLDSVSVTDRSDGSPVQVSGSSVSGATATLP